MDQASSLRQSCAILPSLHSQTFVTTDSRLLSPALAVQGPTSWWELIRLRTREPFAGSSSRKWFRSRTAQSSVWNSAVSFRAGSLFRRAAWSGICPRSKNGWRPGERVQSPVASRSMFTVAGAALSKAWIEFQKWCARWQDSRSVFLTRNPGVHRVRPLLRHVAPLHLVFGLVIYASR